MSSEPNFQLNGKTALVTGASGGIGLAVVKAYLSQGASCLACDLKEGEELKALMKIYPDRLVFRACDVSNTAMIKETIDFCEEQFGGIDILFNNAAIFDMAPLEASNEEMFDRLFAVNVKGMFFIMQGAASSMIKRQTKGKIINMSSQAGRRGEALVSHYCATKAAVISYTQSAALALAPHAINVNAISPGVVDTPMWGHVDALFARYENLKPGEKKAAVGKAVPLGRMGKPEDVVGAAVFLASPASDYITGQTLNVDGGNVLS